MMWFVSPFQVGLIVYFCHDVKKSVDIFMEDHIAKRPDRDLFAIWSSILFILGPDPKYPPVTARQHLENRFAATYGDRIE